MAHKFKIGTRFRIKSFYRKTDYDDTDYVTIVEQEEELYNEDYVYKCSRGRRWTERYLISNFDRLDSVVFKGKDYYS